MQLNVSTSTIGHEDRKPLEKAYMFQRRVLLGCSIMMVVAMIIWIVAISTDHWIIISGVGGIFIPDTRRFFMSSHSGLWRLCRTTQVPYALPYSKVARNFTSIAFQGASALADAKISLATTPVIREFADRPLELPLRNFTDDAKQRMFAHWVRNEEEMFQTFKRFYWELELSSKVLRLIPINSKPISINPLDVPGLEASRVFGDALREVVINQTTYFIVIPVPAQEVIFEGWNDHRLVPKLLWPYVRDLDIPAYVLDEDRVILQLVPPKPPRKGKISNGYEYILSRRCKYIEMFPDATGLRSDPGFDDELMDYVRTQASFACITVFVMCLGCVFSFYTFMNPRYMFKRLAGGIHLVAAATSIVVIQVLFSSVDYTKEHLFYAYPEGAELRYGYGVLLAWITFLTCVICGILFLWYSGKKKGNKAACEELAMVDEGTIMGR